MAAAVVKLDALADAVWAAAEDDDFFFRGGRGFADGFVKQARLIGRIHVRRWRGKLCRARVYALVNRIDVERRPERADIGLGFLGELGETRI